jgi:hypothetical protein
MMRGKEISKTTTLFATAYILIMPILNNVFQWGMSIDGIVKVTLTLIAIQSPYSLSIWIDKITHRGTDGCERL